MLSRMGFSLFVDLCSITTISIRTFLKVTSAKNLIPVSSCLTSSPIPPNSRPFYLSIHSSVYGPLGCLFFSLVHIMSYEHSCIKFLLTYASFLLGISSGNRVVRLYSISFLRNWQAIFQNGVILYSYQQCVKFLTSHIFTSTVLFCLFTIVILEDGKCISLWFWFTFLW
jgi:hypothetical protein